MLKIFKAYADETRLKIIGLLLSEKAQKGLCVCQIQNALGMKQAAVSKAMTVLKNAEVVYAEKKGLWVRYYIKNTGVTVKLNEIVADNVKEKKFKILPPEECCGINKKRCKK